ncbi:MAG: hypothetical protein PHQ59_02005 [Candidatus Daviesbacteria bacterium]|nr:hypothetical protein [Candidatus Daviesbacteria bacterium]
MKNKQSFSTNKLITFLLVVLLLGTFLSLGNLFLNKTNPQTLINPDGKTLLQQITNQNISPTPTPSPTPIEYHFDKTTDLKQEIETINPEVKNSDFDNLNKITNQF